MSEELKTADRTPTIGLSGALQPQNYEAFMKSLKRPSFPQNDTSVTVIEPEVDLEKEL